MSMRFVSCRSLKVPSTMAIVRASGGRIWIVLTVPQLRVPSGRVIEQTYTNSFGPDMDLSEKAWDMTAAGAQR